MLERFLHASKRIQGPLLFHLRTVATSLAEDGYRRGGREVEIMVPCGFGAVDGTKGAHRRQS